MLKPPRARARPRSLASALEQEHAKRTRLPKVRAAPTILKLENEIEDHRKVRVASGEALSALRDSRALGDPGSTGKTHAVVLEAAILVSSNDAVVMVPSVVKSLRRDVDAHVKLVRRALRKADRTNERREM